MASDLGLGLRIKVLGFRVFPITNNPLFSPKP